MQCMEEDKNVDVLIRNARKNRYACPLLQLPDDVLITLMKSMDIDCVLRLRHVSRIFMRLFHIDGSFREYHLTKELNSAQFLEVPRIWAAPNLLFHDQRISWIRPVCDNCRPLLDFDPSSPETIPEMPRLQCAACQSTHGLVHFSASQREEPDSERICRAHESQFTFCSHLSLNLQQIKWYAKTGTEVAIGCGRRHEKRNFTCGNSECDNFNRPKITIKQRPDGIIEMKIAIESHFRLKRLSSGKICPRSLRDELRRLEGSEKDRPWMPIFAFAKGDILRAFDPNVCDCVDWFGDSTQTPKDHAHRSELPLRPAPTIEWREGAPPGYYTSTKGRCSGMRHWFSFDSRTTETYVDILPCLGKKEMAVARQQLYCYIYPHIPADTGLKFFLDGAPLGCATPTCASEICGVKQMRRDDICLPSLCGLRNSNGANNGSRWVFGSDGQRKA